MKKNNTFKEQYLVKLNYQKPDGFWVYGYKLNVFVDVKHGKNEKNNHVLAIKKALDLYPEGKIVSVVYC